MNRTSKFLSRALDAGAQCFSALAPRTRASALEWAWSQHASGRCLAAGIGYLRAGTAAPIRVLAFQLRRTSEATGEAFTTRQALRFVAFATAQLKTRPVAEANALIALETLLPLLSSENRSKLHLAFAPLQNVGTFSYLRAGDTSDIPLAVARYRQALKAAQPEPRALGQLACIDPAAARDFLTVSTLDTETAYTHLLLGEDVAHCFEILCRLLPDTVGPVLEQFGHDPAWVESTLARMRAPECERRSARLVRGRRRSRL